MMSDPIAISLDIGRAAPLKFETKNHAVTWIGREVEAWHWLNDARVRISAPHGSFNQQVLNLVQGLANEINSFQNQPGQKEALQNRAKQVYVDNRIPLSTDPIFLLAQKFVSNDNYGAAIAAVSAFAGRVTLKQDTPIPFVLWEGIVAAAMLQAGVSPETPQILADSLKNVAGQFQKLAADAISEFADRKKLFDQTIERSNTRLVKVESEVKDSWDKASGERLASIQATEATYKEQMHLQASVDYWSGKAREHRQAAKSSRWWLIGYSFVGTVILIVFLVWLSILSAEKSQGDTVIYLKFAAVGAVAVTIMLWAGRVLLRIFLSDRHLATDAEERVVMVKTFLALTNEAKIEPSDRALVLGSLFKSAADGIVKEDSTPDATIAAIIARGLDRQSPIR